MTMPPTFTAAETLVLASVVLAAVGLLFWLLGYLEACEADWEAERRRRHDENVSAILGWWTAENEKLDAMERRIKPLE